MGRENYESLKKLSVLYVEDDYQVQKQFTNVLKKVFSNVLIAANGQEGLELYKENNHKIDFIIADVQMPEMDGLEMIEEIRKTNSDIACILVTSHGEFDYFIRANDLGVYRYIQKPLDINELFEAIKDFQSGFEVKKIDL
jgi:YesN/AraC family two-component response regulator